MSNAAQTKHRMDKYVELSNELTECYQKIAELEAFKKTVLSRARFEDEEVSLDEFIQIGCGKFVTCSFYLGRAEYRDAAKTFENAAMLAAMDEVRG